MDVDAELHAACTPAVLFGLVDDLALYPRWVDLVHRADPLGADAGAPTWAVELRARLGPLARSKRLRMERTVHDTDNWVAVFERRELDGRRHSPWVLRAEVHPAGAEATLRMHLHYGGGLWTGGVLERALADQIRSGSERLAALAQAL